MTTSKPLHIHVTLPILLLIAGIVLSNLLPDWPILEKVLPPSQQYKWIAWLIKALVVVISLLFPFSVYLRFATDGHEKEKRELFMASLKIINRRVGITLEQIGIFKELFEQNKYFLEPEQEETISKLISDLGDVRILDEETNPNSAITKEQKIEYLRERNIFLNNIEAIEPTIEAYLRKLY